MGLMRATLSSGARRERRKESEDKAAAAANVKANPNFRDLSNNSPAPSKRRPSGKKPMNLKQKRKLASERRKAKKNGGCLSRLFFRQAVVPTS
jgi:hypothetical protein